MVLYTCNPRIPRGEDCELEARLRTCYEIVSAKKEIRRKELIKARLNKGGRDRRKEEKQK